MKNFKLAFLGLCALALAGCSGKTVVKGVVDGAAGAELVARILNVNVYETLDTLKTSSDGSFRLNVDVKKGQPEFIYLFYKETKIASLLLENGEKPFVKADTLGNYTVEGSEGSLKLASVEKDYADFMSAFLAAQGDNKTLSKLYIDYYRSRVKYVLENPNSLTCVPVLFQKFGQYNPVFSQHTDAIQFRAVCDSLKAVYPESKYVKALEKETKAREQKLELYTRISSIEPSNFPEITLPDIKGLKQSLSKVASKVILLHFWDASNAAQKMINIEVLLPIYEKYASKGFEIYSVCLSPDKVEWATAVRSQKLPWINVFDGTGAYSQSASIYGVTELPSSILISDGNIMTSAIKGGEGLDRKLAEILK